MSVADPDPGSNAFFYHILRAWYNFVDFKILCQFRVAPVP
jgi:hypothetical protein